MKVNLEKTLETVFIISTRTKFPALCLVAAIGILLTQGDAAPLGDILNSVATDAANILGASNS